MRCEVVAVGTELLLGQVVDTNSAWIGEQLALAGIDSHFQVKVGDNQARIVTAIRDALARSDAVICCGGLGPTQDDITREAIAEVMGVELRRDDAVAAVIREMFATRGRVMSDNNLRQADVPEGAIVIPQTRGTAPGLICPAPPVEPGIAGDSHGVVGVVYAVPGVPTEMREMVRRAVIPDLQRRSGTTATILSRTLRTWGLAESTLAEVIAPRVDALEASGNPTIAFLASGIEGLKVRITAKGDDAASVRLLLDEEEAALRALLGDVVFGVDDESMEVAVAALLRHAGLTLGLAESLTGGLVGARITGVPGASEFFRGAIVSYDRAVKHDLLGVPPGPVVSEAAAGAMAVGAARVLGADVGLAVTGVAGPEEQDGQPVGTVWLGLALDGEVSATLVRLPGHRQQVRQLAAISLLDLLRRRLTARAGAR
ncbi:MAG: nicotinamide-nucleotide amidase [Acidimicrobiaceae bacterium]|nr:nicotinamide-nucleotide amidase [Acidimicrobiaceae bacterium]